MALKLAFGTGGGESVIENYILVSDVQYKGYITGPHVLLKTINL